MKESTKEKHRRLSIKVDRMSPKGNIRLKILGTQGDFNNLSNLKPEEKKEIFDEVINKAIIQIIKNRREKPRGPFSQDQDFTGIIKRLASYTHYILKELLKSQPESKFVQGLVKEYEKKHKSYNPKSGKKKKTKPHELTAFILDRYFGKEAKKRGLIGWPEDPNHFRRTYIKVERLSVPRYRSHLNYLRNTVLSLIKFLGDDDPFLIFQWFYDELLDESQFQKYVDPFQTPTS